MCLASCIMLDFSSAGAQTDSLNIMMFKTMDDAGNLGYRKLYNLCFTDTKLMLVTGDNNDLEAAVKVDNYFRKAIGKLDCEYTFGSEQSGNDKLYIFEFSVFEKLDGEQDPYFDAKSEDRNLFREKYYCTIENLAAGLPSLFADGQPFGNIESVFPSIEPDSFPVNYYVYGNSEHITPIGGEGTRTVNGDSGSVTFGYWKSTLGNPPAEFAFYRNLPVTLGWNILAISIGIIVVAVPLTIMLIKNIRKKSHNSEGTEENDARENEKQ